jgi:uncharacterized protein YdhG (YjbR/CyaY superfamily)
MDSKKNTYTTINEYIAQFSPEIQAKLKEIQAVIKAAAPEASEKISYQMPTFYLQGNLVHFAAYKHHIGFYPNPGGIEQFAQELSRYETSKGAIRFPINEPIPLDLVRRITAFRVQQNQEKANQKAKHKVNQQKDYNGQTKNIG